MAQLKKYNLTGKEVGSVQVDDRLAAAEANSQLVKDYIVALRANARQWSASTKTRAEVAHTTKKPRPQKGTGGARQGTLVATQHRGGGRVFTPKPKFDQHVRINQTERRAAIRFLIGEKIRGNNLIVVDDISLKKPETKKVAGFLKACNIDGRTLFVGQGAFRNVETEGKTQKISVKSDQHENFVLSMRNIPKTEFLLAQNISGYDVMVAGHVIVTESALKEITEWLI